MTTPRLIFHPRDAQQTIPRESLVQSMREIGFIAEGLAGHEGDCYAAGGHFIDLLSFLGCSPVINLSPEDGDKFCYIELMDLPAAELISGSQAFQPRCSQCRLPLPDWKRQLNTRSTIQCHECMTEMSLEQVNWKQSAGYASQFMLVHNIYLHEAVPVERLLMTLQAISHNKAWNYFYVL